MQLRVPLKLPNFYAGDKRLLWFFQPCVREEAVILSYLLTRKHPHIGTLW